MPEIDTPTADTADTALELIPEPSAPDTVREKTLAQYHFTPAELGDLGKRLSTSRKDAGRIEAELASVKAEYKSKLETVELEQDSICRKLDDGFEMREAFAVVTFNDPTRGRKTYRHEEGGALIKEEAMTQGDWQLPMFRTPEGTDATAPTQTPDDPDPTPTPSDPTPFTDTHSGDGTRNDVAGIGNDAAGSTRLGDLLDAAGAAKPANRILLDLEKDDWQPGPLVTAFKKAAMKAGWDDVQISTMTQVLKDARENADEGQAVAAMIASLRPHTLAGDAPPATNEPAENDVPL